MHPHQMTAPHSSISCLIHGKPSLEISFPSGYSTALELTLPAGSGLRPSLNSPWSLYLALSEHISPLQPGAGAPPQITQSVVEESWSLRKVGAYTRERGWMLSDRNTILPFREETIPKACETLTGFPVPPTHSLTMARTLMGSLVSQTHRLF